MNLYLFNANDSAATYGIGSYLRELTQALEGDGINIHIVHLHSTRAEFEIVSSTSLTNRADSQNTMTSKVKHWYVPEVFNHNTFSGDVQKLENYSRNVAYLLRLYIKDTKDLIFHFNFNQYQFLAKEMKAAFECKTIATVHFIKWMLELHGNHSRFQALKSKPENQRNLYEQLLCTTDEYESALYTAVDHVIALSHYTKNLLCAEYQLGPNKVTVIPNGLDDINPEIKRHREALRKKRQIMENEYVILFVGRLQAAKGLFFLIEAFHKVLEKKPECRLIVSGNGDMESYMQAAKNIIANVTFTGLLEKKDLYELYELSDIGALPSLTEQCSYVAIEMMRHRLPIVGSNTAALKEMILNDETGLLVPVTEYDNRVEIDTDLLAEKMLYLLRHSEERERMGANARKRYEEKYTSDIFRENMLNFYKSIL